MRMQINFQKTIFLLLCVFCFISCDNDDDVTLVDSSYKEIELFSGYDFEIPLLTNNWNVEYVEDVISDREMLDKDGNLLMLSDNNTVEAANGWLTLSRTESEVLTIVLKENFDITKERKFVICINDAGKRDYITVTQHSGEVYELVKTEYEEIEELREVYESDEGCSSIILSNNTSEETWLPTGQIFKDVVESSIFESDDYGAFDWFLGKEMKVRVPELIIDNTNPWSGSCIYKEGLIENPYIENVLEGNKILVKPHSSIRLEGRVIYCNRAYNYTFTVENKRTGVRFEIGGVWTQIVPISSITISF